MTNQISGRISIAAPGGGGGALHWAHIEAVGFAQNVPTATPTALHMGDVGNDTDNYAITSDVLTIEAGTGGIYLVISRCTFFDYLEALSTPAAVELDLIWTGGNKPYLGSLQPFTVDGVGKEDVGGLEVIALADGDVVSLSAYQASGSTLRPYPSLTIVKQD